MERRMGTRKQAVTMGQCWLGPGIEGWYWPWVPSVPIQIIGW
jgi:hypothetical protein